MPTVAHGRRTSELEDSDMVARAAWLHYVGGLTQSEVARRLHISNTRAHRFIARAESDGLVRVFVDVEHAGCVQLETALMERYGLTLCRVAMDVPEPGPLPLRALSALGADFLMRAVQSGTYPVIGIGNGRTLSAAVDAMGRTPAGAVRFVSLMGGLTRSYAANPYDVIHKLAQKTGAESYLMPVPLFADSPQDKKVLQAQSGLSMSMRLIDEAALMLIGIGSSDAEAGAASATSLGAEAARGALKARGAEAEILGQFLDGDGNLLPSDHDARVMAPPLTALRQREVVAIAGGQTKTGALRAALRSGLLTGLILDEATARSLADNAPETGAGTQNQT